MKSWDQTELKHTLQKTFPTLNEETLHAILPFCEFKQARKHAEVHSEGKHHPYSYMILKGAAKGHCPSMANVGVVVAAWRRDLPGGSPFRHQVGVWRRTECRLRGPGRLDRLILHSGSALPPRRRNIQQPAD